MSVGVWVYGRGGERGACVRAYVFELNVCVCVCVCVCVYVCVYAYSVYACTRALTHHRCDCAFYLLHV